MLWPPVCCCTCLQRTLRRYLVPANSCAGCQTVSTFGGRCFGRISCLAPVTSANSHCLPPSSCTNPGCCSEKNDWRLGRCGGTCVLALALFSFLARDCLCIVLFQAALREKKQSEHARKMESRQVCSLVRRLCRGSTRIVRPQWFVVGARRHDYTGCCRGTISSSSSPVHSLWLFSTSYSLRTRLMAVFRGRTGPSLRPCGQCPVC
jgi:hypothetical protein